MSGPICRIEQIRQEYSGKTVLDIDSLDIAKGGIVGLTGPNGSGKSTLLHILAFLEQPTQGNIFFQGQPCDAKTDGIRRKVSLLNQEPYLLKRSVGANVAYGLKVRGAPDISRRVDKALSLVGLNPDDFSSRAWYELSGGEAQRVALAARLVLEPELLLLDEPTASLDEESASLVESASLKARERGITLVVASHDMEWLKAVCDTTIDIVNGRLRER